MQYLSTKLGSVCSKSIVMEHSQDGMQPFGKLARLQPLFEKALNSFNLVLLSNLKATGVVHNVSGAFW